jgi:hypothetical protein
MSPEGNRMSISIRHFAIQFSLDSKCRYHTRPFGADVLLLMDNMRPVNGFLNEDWSTT